MGPVLCLITPRTREVEPHTLLSRVAEAARAGVHLIQVRDPDLDARALCELVRACLGATSGTSARVVVNDRLDVALVTGSAGVHLREDSLPAPVVRTMVPRRFLVGRSLHTVDDVARLTATSGVDYALLGPVFATASKPDATPIGPAALADAARRTPVPVLALGGVTPSNAGQVAAAGAAGIAGIGLWAAPDVTAVARAVATAFGAAGR